MADNLESFFKKHLSDESQGDDNWNMPSDDIWDKALPEFQKKSGVFIPWKYLIIIGIFILTGAGLSFFIWMSNSGDELIDNEISEVKADNNNQKNISKTTLNTNSTEIKKEEEIVIVENTQTAQSDILVLNSQKNDNAIIKDETTRNNQPNYNTNSTITKAIELNEQKEINNSNDNEEVISEYDIDSKTFAEPSQNESDDRVKVDDESDEVLIIATQGIINMSMDSLEAEKPIIMAPDTLTTDQDQKSMSEIPPIDKKVSNINFDNKGKVNVGVFFSPTYTSTYLNGNKIPGIENTPPVFLYSSNFGLEFKYHISNKFAVVAGFSSSEVKSWSKAQVDFGYDSSTEHIIESGDKANTSAIPMPTPFGEVGTEVTFSFPGSEQIPDGEMMQSSQETHQKILYFSIPIGVEYNIINKNRINWFAEAGLQFNNSVLDGSEFSSKITHYGYEMNIMTEEVSSSPNFKEMYLGYYIGSGAGYRFSKSFQLSTSVRYFGNISKVNLQDNMTTNVRGFNLKIGINYFF